MLIRNFLPVIGAAGLFAFAPDADAQAGIAGKCARIIFEFVGEPLIKAAAGEIGGAFGRYLAGLAQKDPDGTATLTREDIEHLKRLAQREGISDCELRRQLEMATRSGSPSSPAYSHSPYQPDRAPPRQASVCLTSAGYCTLGQILPVGVNCGCHTSMGVFYGITQ